MELAKSDYAPLNMLTRRQQIALGVATVLLLVVPFLFKGSLTVMLLCLLSITAFLILRNALLSIFVLIILEVLTTMVNQSYHGDDKMNTIEYLIGISMAVLTFAWFVRIRVIESQPLSGSKGTLMVILFGCFSIISSLFGLLAGSNVMFVVAEILNLTPILILPLLYEKYVLTDSRSERSIFWAVLFVALMSFVWNVFHVRSTIVITALGDQVGRAGAEESFGGLLVLLAISIFMSKERPRSFILGSFLFLIGICDLIITLRRSLYIAIVPSAIILLICGTTFERRRGIRRLSFLSVFGIAVVVYLYFSMQVIRMLLVRYFFRFLSSEHIGTDISLRDRYAEWRDLWHAFVQSPLFGYGFGGVFKHYSLTRQYDLVQRMSHSSYLYFLFKSGLIGGLLFFAGFIYFIVFGLKLARRKDMPPHHQLIVRVAAAFLILLAIVSFTEPYLEYRSALIWIGLIWGYFLALEKNTKKGESHTLHTP